MERFRLPADRRRSGCSSFLFSISARGFKLPPEVCSFSFTRPIQHGTSQDQDGEEGRQGHHREVLHPAGERLPHQQEGVRGDRHHPQQEATQQDRRVCDASDEEDPERSSQRNLHQAAGGGEGEEGQLRARGVGSGPGAHRSGSRHKGDAEAAGLRRPVQPAGDPAHRGHELQAASRSLDCLTNKNLWDKPAAGLTGGLELRAV